jgi:hypothetical protein
MFIPDPDFYPSRIQKQQEKREGKFVVISFFVATNFTKLKIILFLEMLKKKFWSVFQEL